MVPALSTRPPVDWSETPLATPEILDALRRHRRHLGWQRSLDACLDPAAPDRQWRQVAAEPGLEVWLVTWPAGSGTGWHDHGPARGAFTVLAGELTEYTWDGVVHARTLPTGGGRAFGSVHVHDVANLGDAPALSLHAYSPRLRGRTRYELLRGRLEVTGVEGSGIL